MQLRILGSSPPYPSPGVATSAYLLEAESTRVLVECGHGAVAVLKQAIDLRELSAVVISHMHPDHFFDLIPLRNSFLHEGLARIPLYLPRRGRRILDAVVRATELPLDYMTEWFDLREFDAADTFAIGEVTMIAAPTVHPIETFSIAFSDPAGRRLVHSSDTAWFPDLPALFAEADLGLVEVTDYPQPHDEGERHHLNPEEVGRLVRDSGLRRVVLTHYESAHAEAIAEIVRSRVDGAEVLLAAPDRVFEV